MGVKNLWDILESCKKTLPLYHLQNKKLCVDLSCWLVQFQTAHRSPAFVKEKVYLRNLFHRIRALIALNCSLIFVTDGAIPSIKLSTYRRRLGSSSEVAREEANSQPMLSLRRNMGSEFSRMIKEAKILGMALGIPCIDGVEEAEAQCALLNSTSFCDGCFTSDSDIFLFGARTVYRDVFIGEGGYVICYEMADIEKKLGFGRKSLISLALLLGGDYSNGVHGFGPETACRFVKSIGDDSILNRILSDGVMVTRKSKGKNIGSDASKVDGICLKTSNFEIGKSQEFSGPFLEVINAYLEPKCHSPDSEAVQRVSCQHPFLRSQLQQICEKCFGWSPEKTDQYILPKIAERELRRFANLRSSSSAVGIKFSLDEFPVPCPVSTIVKQKTVRGSDHYEVSWTNIDGLQVSVVSGDLLRSACPEKITEFMEQKGEQKKLKRRSRPKPSTKAAVKDVNMQLQELLLSIESEDSTLSSTSPAETADTTTAALNKDIVDLSSPSPPLRACKLAKSQKFTAPTTAAGSQKISKLNGVSNNNTIDLASPLPLGACKLGKGQNVRNSNKASRNNINMKVQGEAQIRALSDITNLSGRDDILDDASGPGAGACKLQDSEARGSDVGVQLQGLPFSSVSDVQNVVAETDAIDPSSSLPLGACKLGTSQKVRSSNKASHNNINMKVQGEAQIRALSDVTIFSRRDDILDHASGNGTGVCKLSESEAAGPDVGVKLQGLPFSSVRDIASCAVQNVVAETDAIDVSSPLSFGACKLGKNQKVCKSNKASRDNVNMKIQGEAQIRALSDITNLSRRDDFLDDASGNGTGLCHLSESEAAPAGVDVSVQLQELPFSNISDTANCRWRTDAQNFAAETDAIDLSSPSPALDGCKLVGCQKLTDQNVDVIDICESENDVSPEHGRKARDLRLFLDSIRDDLY